MFNRKIGTISKKIHTPYEGMFGLGGTQGYEKEVTGTMYIDLTNAIANKLLELKAYGGTEQRNLPSGYTEYDGLIGDGTAYIDLNCTLDQNDEIELEFTMPATAVNSINIFGYRNSASSQAITAMIASSNTNLFISDFNNSDYNPYRLATASPLSVSTRYKVVINKTGRYLYQGSTLVESNTTACPDTILTGNAYLFNVGGTPAYNNKFQGTIHRCLIKGKRDVVPCGDGTAYGMYDKLNGVFYPNANTEGSFTVGNATVPSPATPIDIVSNNGVLKARHQSGLPLGYTLLEYAESTGTQYIDTGIIGESNWKISAQGTQTYSGTQILVGGSNSTGRWLGIRLADDCWGITGVSSGIPYSTKIVAEINFTDSANTTVINGNTITTSTTGTLGNYLLFNQYNQSDLAYPFYGKIFYAKAYQNNTLVRDLVPCKNASNVVGMYDLVSGQFFTNQGTGDFIAGDPVSDPVEIYTDGTVETVNAHGKNLFNSNTILQGYIDANGDLQSSTNIGRSALIPVIVGETYTWSGTHNRNNTTNKRLHGYDSNGDWVEQLGSTAASLGTNYSVTATIPSGIAYVCLSGIRLDTPDTNIQFEFGSTATTYEPYYDGGTATAEMLLKVGDYQDVQSIIDGVVTRNVGVKVLDGTEEWYATISDGWYLTGMYCLRISDLLGENANITTNRQSPYCTHFERSTNWISVGDRAGKIQTYAGGGHNMIGLGYGTVSDANLPLFKQYLADQYAAGTPVIIVYQLATPTTETVTGQPMDIQAGTNTIEITQASIDNLQLYAKYKSTQQ